MKFSTTIIYILFTHCTSVLRKELCEYMYTRKKKEEKNKSERKEDANSDSEVVTTFLEYDYLRYFVCNGELFYQALRLCYFS